MANKIWTKERLTQMRDEFLPQCKTIGQALDLAKIAYKRPNRPETKAFRNHFVQLFKHSPTKYLRADVVNKDLSWTAERLEWMRTTALPESRTVVDALQWACRKYNRHFNNSWFRYEFVKKYNFPPSSYVGAKLATNADNDVNLPPNENPVFLRREINRLEKELKHATEQSKIAFLIKSMLRKLADTPSEELGWLNEPARKEMFHGIPSLFLSDIHHGETVFPQQVDGANSYNMRISRERLFRIFNKTIYILENVFNEAYYPGIVVAMGGDLLNGNIHEELRNTNEKPIFETLLDLADILTEGITMLKEHFGRVFLPCVVGNHGRLSKRPTCKYGPQDNYEYMLYHYLASRFEDDPNVTFKISDGFTTHFRLYQVRYLLTHGDQFKGGSGITGPILPWTLGDHRLRKQMQTMAAWTKKPVEYDVLLIAHFHQYFPARSFLVNGSICGMTEFSKKMGFPYEPPQQALWITNPEYGMTFNTSVLGVTPEPVSPDNQQQWVSIPS